MRHFIALATIAGSMTALFWIDVVSNGAELCNSSVEFNTQLDTIGQREAAKQAKNALCNVVRSFPM